MCVENWEAFALAIVKQAVDDYRSALRFMKSRGKLKKTRQYVAAYKNNEKLPEDILVKWVYPYFKAERTIKECEKFFRSSDMEMYAPGINGEAVIDEMRERYYSDIPNYYEEQINGKT